MPSAHQCARRARRLVRGALENQPSNIRIAVSSRNSRNSLFAMDSKLSGVSFMAVMVSMRDAAQALLPAM